MRRSYGIVSYYVQKLFAELQGVRYLDTAVQTEEIQQRTAASATCDDADCDKIALKVRRLITLTRCTLGSTLHVAPDVGRRPPFSLTHLVVGHHSRKSARPKPTLKGRDVCSEAPISIDRVAHSSRCMFICGWKFPLYQPGSDVLSPCSDRLLTLAQIVNFGTAAQNVSVSLLSIAGDTFNSAGRVTTITSDDPLDENSFQTPEKVSFSGSGHCRAELMTRTPTCRTLHLASSPATF